MSQSRTFPTPSHSERTALKAAGLPADLIPQIADSRIPISFVQANAHRVSPGEFRSLTYLFNVEGLTADIANAYLDGNLEVHEIDVVFRHRIGPESAAWLSKHNCLGEVVGFLEQPDLFTLENGDTASDAIDWYEVAVIVMSGRSLEEISDETLAWLGQSHSDNPASSLPGALTLQGAGLDPYEAADILDDPERGASLATLLALSDDKAIHWGSN